MAVELRVPEVGESITEVQIGDWLKQEGDVARRDEAVVMIETDKVTVELPAPVDGVISKIIVTKGQQAHVGDIVGYIEEKAAVASPSAAKNGGGNPNSSSSKSVSEVAQPSAPTPAAVSGAKVNTASVASPAAAPAVAAHVMPAAARALHDNGLSASQVSASGPGGRLLKEDVEKQALAVANARPAQLPTVVPHESSDREEEVVAMTPMRRRIAERLVESQQTAALLTTFNEIDTSELKSLRERYQPLFTEKYGIKLGLTSFFVKAVIDALKQFPAINAEVRGTDIVYKNYYDVGVAVGGGKGLVVPVIRNADRLSFSEVEKTIADFGVRAKKNALKLEELQGGTFTISNGGIYGSLLSTPIVNPPQSGILGLHGIFDRPIALNGQVVIRPMMYVALTYDHRIVDGREAVSFLKRIKEAIEQPARMLLEV